MFNNIHNIKIEKKIALLFLVIAVVGLVVSSATMGYFLNKTKIKTYNELSNSSQLIMSQKHESLSTVTYTNMLSIASNSELVDAVKTDNRAKAIEILQKIEKNIEANSKFSNFKVHLHTKDGHAFLRSWKMDKFGDDLTSFRNTIPYIIKNHKPFVTTEVGKTGMTIRGIVPLVDQENNYVGSAEFISSFDPFVPWLKKNEKSDLLVLLDKNYQVKTKADDIYIGKYLLSQKEYNTVFLENAKNIDISKFDKNKYIVDDNYLYTSVPIYDFSHKKIGLYLIGKPMNIVDAIVEDGQNMIYTALFMIAFLLLFTTVVSIYALRKLVFKRLENFQEGLMSFFAYFGDKTLKVEPIKVNYKDEIGNMAVVVNEQIKVLQEDIANEQEVIAKTTKVIEDIGSGVLTHRIDVDCKNETLNEMINLLNNLFESLEKSVGKDVSKIVSVLTEYSQCNYTNSIPNASGQVEKTINRMQEVITQMLVLNVQSSEKLQLSSSELSKNVVLLNESSTEQFDSIENSLKIMNEINQAMDVNVEKLNTMGKQIDSLVSSADEGEKLSNETGKSMDIISTKVEDILKSIEIIDEISFQTNILSLNAAVEAATAGESGKGFAVVAQEVRNLASKSAEAAQNIKEQVENATKLTMVGKDSSSQMLKGYTELKAKISQTIEDITVVSDTIKAQNSDVQEINNVIQDVKKNAQNNHQIAMETETIAKNTNTLSSEIVKQAKKSKYNELLKCKDKCGI